MTDNARENSNELSGSAADEPVSDHDPAFAVAGEVASQLDGALAYLSHGQAVVYVNSQDFAEAARILKDDHDFTTCVDVTAVDHLLDGVRHCPAGVKPERFEVVAGYLSHRRNLRVRVIAQVSESEPVLPSVTPVFAGANFGEREAYDLLGVTFDGHPDLVRILMPDDWQGHPLRKDAYPARVPVTFKGDPSPR